MDCGSRSDAQGDCKSCSKAGPLMDLQDPSVRAELISEDDRRRSNRRYLMVWPSVPLALVAIILLGGGLIGFALGGALGYGSSLVLAAIFPARPRFPYLRS
jgi:hypothetical protein